MNRHRLLNLCFFLLISSAGCLMPFLESSQVATLPRAPQVPANLIREGMEWYYRQRAYPLPYVPAGARRRALDALSQKVAAEAAASNQSARLTSSQGIQPFWSLLGPEPTDTPYSAPVVSGRITALAVDPRNSSTVYAGAADGGVWKTTDGAATWAPLTDTQVSLAVGAIALDPSNPETVYVGTGEENFSGDSYYGEGILKSTNGGLSWMHIPGPFAGPIGPDSYFGGGAHIGSLAVDPGDSSILLAGVQLLNKDGVYRSIDGGNTWTEVLSGAPGTSVVFDTRNSNIVYAALGNPTGSSANGVYKSMDAGATWAADSGTQGQVLPSANTGRIALALAPSSPTTLYAGIQDSSPSSFNTLLGFFVTKDGGAHWNQLTATPDYCTPQCRYDHVVAVDPTNAKVIYAGGAFSTTLVRSLDGGATWSILSAAASGGTLHADVHALVFSADGSKLYLGNDGGVWSTTDVAATQVNFAELNDKLAITQFYTGISIGPRGTPLAFGGTQDNGTQKYTGSRVWENVTCGDGGSTALDPVSPSTVYTFCQPYAVEKSTSGGNFGTWFVAESGINTGDRSSFFPPLVIDSSNSQALYFGTYRVYQTLDGASSWQAISPDLTGGPSFFGNLTAVAVAPNDSNTVYAGSGGSHVNVTTNAGAGPGALWTDRSAGLPPRFITQVAVDPKFAKTAYVTFSGFSGFVDK